MMPPTTAAIICTAYRKKPIAEEEKTPIPAAPIMNDGPELLQNMSSLSASVFETSPFSLSEAM